jgi:hypothetical protein
MVVTNFWRHIEDEGEDEEEGSDIGESGVESNPTLAPGVETGCKWDINDNDDDDDDENEGEQEDKEEEAEGG